MLEVGNPSTRRYTLWKKKELISEMRWSSTKVYSDYRNPTNLTAYVALFNLITEIEQGTNEDQRISNSITVPWLSINSIFNTRNEATSAPSDGLVRHIVFVDWQSNGTSPTLGELLDTTTGYTNGNYNMDYVPNRFGILYDDIIQIPTGSNTWNGATFSNGLGYKSKMIALEGTEPIRLRYTGTGDNPSDIAEGAIWNMYLSQTANIRVGLAHRCHFVDGKHQELRSFFG